MKKVCVGIDPGQKGIISVLDYESGSIIEIFPIPLIEGDKKVEVDPVQLYAKFKYLKSKFNVQFVTIEKQSARPNMAGTNALMTSYGYLIMACVANGMKMIVVTPKVWQKEMFKSMSKEDTKICSIKRFMELYPESIDLIRTVSNQGKEIYNNNISDSVLIANYGRKEAI